MADTPASKKRAPRAAPPVGHDRVASRYVVGEVVPTSDGVWIRLIDTVTANGRHAAVKDVVGTREGRWFVCAEANSEIVTYGPPPDPTPTLIASQSVSSVLAEPVPVLSAHFGGNDAGISTTSEALPADPAAPAEGDPVPLIAPDEPWVDERTAREGQPIPIDPDAA